MVVGQSNGFDIGVTFAATLPAIIAALYAFRANVNARAAHEEVKSPNGTKTGIQAYEMAKRQEHMQVTQAEINELAHSVARDLHNVRAEQARVNEELVRHTGQDEANFQALRDALHAVIQNQEYIKQRGEEMTAKVAERLDLEGT